MTKLAVITTHPIQYYAPLFRELSLRRKIQVKVFYTWEQGAEYFDMGFGKALKWDIPLLDGYEYEFVSNNGSLRKDFRGVKNPGLESAISNWGADSLLVFGWNYLSHLRAMRYFKGKIPVWFRGDSNLLDPQGKLKKLARKWFLRWVYSNVDGAFYVGSNNKEYFTEYGLNDNQLVFAPHAIDNIRFRNLDPDNEQFVAETKCELRLNEPGFTILYVGKFQQKKDPALLLDAVVQLNNPSIRLLLVGNGELEVLLKQKAEGMSNIRFLPFQNQYRMPAIYRLGDVFCLPSKGPGETWGLAVNEAMASGKPVLVSDKAGCAKDLIDPARNGYVFKSGEITDLKQKILDLQKHDLLKMGEISSSLINEWTIDKVSEQIECVFNK